MQTFFLSFVKSQLCCSTYLVVVKGVSTGPVLCRREHKPHVGLLRNAILIPPSQLNHILTARVVHPLCQALRHEPAQLGPVASVERLHAAVVQVVVVGVTDDHGVDLRQVVDGARHLAVALGTQKG